MKYQKEERECFECKEKYEGYSFTDFCSLHCVGMHYRHLKPNKCLDNKQSESIETP